MTIERTEPIKFHEQGTLNSVTRWLASHHDGIAEWMKNIRRQYQVDRANVAEAHRVALLLFSDGNDNTPARIGVLDVGGATLEDVTAWKVWQDPRASRRPGHSIEEEETQGNGGKTYMYRLFKGETRILGVNGRRHNCVGFEGEPGTVERGSPGWMPTVSAGRDVEISSCDGELRKALEPYGIAPDDLPAPVRVAIGARQAFTLVEGEGPIGFYKDRIEPDELIAKIVRHEQSTLCLEQVVFYAIHNGRLLMEGKNLTLPDITPYPGLDSPTVHDILDMLPLNDGQLVSTTEGGSREPGRLTLHTSADSMWLAWKNLRPRWQILYRTKHQVIGSKAVSEYGTTPGSQFVYGTVELPALEPAYVDHGRRRPKEGPLLEALDRFIAEKIRELAQKINVRRKEALDEVALDEVHKENRELDEFKNRFLPSSYSDGVGGSENGGTGPGNGDGGGATNWGTEPESLRYSVPEGGIHLAEGVAVPIRPLVEASVRDPKGLPVRVPVEWKTSDSHVADFSADGMLMARGKGTCSVWARVQGTAIESEQVPVRVWNVDHVLLTPRKLEMPLGTRGLITAEVTDDEGDRSTDVLLDWRHDAEDAMVVLISQAGTVTANRIGRTSITAGAGSVWARIPVEVLVVPNPEKRKPGSGFPRLLLTGRDLDPATQAVREGDPDQPALWQEPSDFINNVWWLNLQSREAAFAFRERSSNPSLWRTYHAERVLEMVVQVWMSEEFTHKGEQQRAEFWAAHQAAMDRHRVRTVQDMWKRMEPYIHNETEWENTAP